MKQWNISSEAAWKQVERSTTTLSSLSRIGMANGARMGRVFLLALFFVFATTFSSGVVMANVGFKKHDDKVIKSIVGLNSIFMMDNLTRRQKSSEFFLHHNPMLINIPFTISKWMIWPTHLNVSSVSSYKANMVSIFNKESMFFGNPSDVRRMGIEDVSDFTGRHTRIGHTSNTINRQQISLISGNSELSHVSENDRLTHSVLIGDLDTGFKIIIVGSKLLFSDKKLLLESHVDHCKPLSLISQEKKSRYSLDFVEKQRCLDKEPNDNIKEIKGEGSRVIIPTLGNVTVRKRLKGAQTIWENISSAPVEFNVNRSTEWAFRLDDVDIKQFVVKGIIDKYAADAAEQTKIVIDTDYLSSIYLDAASYNQGATAGKNSSLYNLGTTGSPVTLSKANITSYILMCEAALNESDVPESERWIVLPTWARFLLDDSEVKDAALTGLSKSNLVDTGGYIRNIGKFRVFESNLYTPVTDSAKTCFNIVFGHKYAVTTATQLTDTQYFDKFENTWGKGMKGLQVYDWKTIKGQGLGVLYATISSLV